MDQVVPPPLLRRLGRRRGWMMTIQPVLAAAAVLLALLHPSTIPAASLAAGALVAFCSASQDIVIDAWRIESFPPKYQGAAMAAYVWAYRVALLVSGSGAIAASAHIGWHKAILIVAALLVLGPVVTLLAPEPGVPVLRNIGSLSQRLRLSVVEPIRDLLSRRGAVTILCFVALFRLGEAMAGVMTAPLYTHLGFNREAIAAANFVPALGASILGAGIGAVLVARLGVGRALLLTGTVQTAAMGMYLWLAASSGSTVALFATVVTEAFAGGMADAAFITFLSGLCTPAFTATQYALLSSLAALALRTVGGLSGFLAAAVGFTEFYAIALFAALPSMALMLVILRRYPPAEKAEAAPAG
jgi:PAT family beta-lactamase induction signal transducer AmpG